MRSKTTETTTEVAYLIQVKDPHGNRLTPWGGAITDQALAEQNLVRLRADYGRNDFRLLRITTTTEVIP